MLRVLSVLLISVSFLRADLVIVQDVDAMGQQLTMTLKTKGPLLRMDLNPQMSVLLDATSGDMKTLMHDQKMFMEMNAEALKGMMPASTQVVSKDKPEIKPLGTFLKINGYDTEEYLFTQGTMVSHIWIAKDFPQYQAFLSAMETLRKGPIGQMSPQLQMDLSLLPGMPMKSVVEINGKAATSTVKSVEEKDLDAADFAPPADYKSFAMPVIPPPAPAQ